jgi:uncharacterized protein
MGMTTFAARCARFSMPRFARASIEKGGAQPRPSKNEGREAPERRRARAASGELRLLLIALAVATLPGCFSLGRDAPPLELYVIGGAESPEAAAPMPGLAGVTIGLRRLDLAPYLATPAIAVRRGAHEILTSDYHRWGEELGEGINRAVARHLGAAAPFRTVDVAPWPVRSRYDYLVQLHVSRFEGVIPAGASAAAGEVGAAVGEVHVAATWEIVRQEDETVLLRGTTEFREGGWRVGDYAALVAGMDRGLVVLARDLTAALGGVVAAGPGAE